MSSQIKSIIKILWINATLLVTVIECGSEIGCTYSAFFSTYDIIVQSGAAGCSQCFVKYFPRAPLADHCLLGQHGSCSIDLTTCATFMKHTARPLEQPDAPHCSI